MAKLSNTQIQQIKLLTPWTSTKFHGNRKLFNYLPVDFVKEIVAKKALRQLHKLDISNKSYASKVKDLINQSKSAKDTPYFKVLIEGNSGIYYASPKYGHNCIGS